MISLDQSYAMIFRFLYDKFSPILHLKPEALKSLYRSPGYKKNQLVLCKNYVLQW